MQIYFIINAKKLLTFSEKSSMDNYCTKIDKPGISQFTDISIPIFIIKQHKTYFVVNINNGNIILKSFS